MDKRRCNALHRQYGITTISHSVLSSCGSLVKVTIPNTVETIEPMVFGNCNSLPSIEIPEGVLSLKGEERVLDWWQGPFSGCESLSSVVLPSSLLVLGEGAFRDCTSLMSIVIPENVSTIGDGAFMSCKNLTDVDLSDVNVINSYAFYGCETLRQIVLPESVVSVNGLAFCGCPELKRMYVYSDVCTLELNEDTVSDTAVIFGHIDSPAQEYANVFGRKFVDIETVTTLDSASDVNVDGQFNISDLVTFQKWLLATLDTELVDWRAADLCEDNRLDVFDLCLMRQKLIKG